MQHSFLIPLIIAFFLWSGNANARNVRIIVPGGLVHMSGTVAEGGCVVSTDSKDMHIDMGQYNTHSFDRLGAISAHSIPFTIRLTDCTADVANRVGISFSGMTTPEAPDLFLVTSAQSVPSGVSGDHGFSGLGVLILDTEGDHIIPGQSPEEFYQMHGPEMNLNYMARYQATSREVYPGPLSSTVQFDISYP